MRKLQIVLAAAALTAVAAGSAFAQSAPSAATSVGRSTEGVTITPDSAKTMSKDTMAKDKMAKDKMAKDKMTSGSATLSPENPSLPGPSDGHK